jgi:signal transduction histidine kinase
MGLAATIGNLSSEEKIRSLGALIEKQSVELDFQMRNIIMAAEIEAGELKKNCTRVHISDLIENQISYLRYRIAQHHVQVDLCVPRDLEFRTDGYILQTICLNLFANAIAHAGDKKKVVIEVSQYMSQLELSVSDFGNGIDPTFQTEIFQRFKQGRSGLMKDHCGHGLGLCIVKELTTWLGGVIELHSSPDGTIVKVVLPEMSVDELTNTVSFGSELLFGDTEIL